MSNPSVPLLNLLILQHKMDNLHRFLSRSVNHNNNNNNNNNAQEQQQQQIVSSEISSAIRDIISNGAALLSSCQSTLNNPPMDLKAIKSNPEEEEEEEEEEEGMNIVELDAMELLAEHVHFCDICGKGFKRDANLRMHMRAHGNQYKTPEALVKPKNDNNNNKALTTTTTRFSCPFSGCNRNKAHKKFRALKSATCVKNHFKRSHCPKMFSCHKCNKKSFSVVADLKSHLKNCGECRWQCCCGTSFSRKDKLFGHMALFEGHMPSMPSSVTCVTTIASSSSSKQQQQQQQQQQDFDDDDDDDASGLGFFDHDFIQGDCFDSITSEDDLFDPGFSFPAFDPPSFLPSFFERRD